MEIKITEFFNRICPRDFSASIAEIGQDAGTITWNASLEEAEDTQLLSSPEALAAFRKFAREFGFENSDTLSNHELQALFIQWIAGDMREMGITTGVELETLDWEQIEKEQQAGQIPSNIYRGTDGEIYFYVGT